MSRSAVGEYAGQLVLSRSRCPHYRPPPTTVQRALGASPDGKVTSLIHKGTGETSRYEQCIEGLTRVSSFMY
jgi:xanthine dehydrogenase YagR molybdenum-binding subunit